MTRTLDSETKVKPVKFAHFVMRAANLDKSIAWYQTVLGMRIVHKGDKLVFLSYDDEHHRLAIVQTHVAKPEKFAPGVDHVAYTLTSLGELLGTYKRLKAAGILPVMPINHGPTTSIYYEDPDGCQVEFQVENYPTMAECAAWFQTETFAENPLGTLFDPDKLVTRYEAGDPLEELVKQGSAPA